MKQGVQSRISQCLWHYRSHRFSPLFYILGLFVGLCCFILKLRINWHCSWINPPLKSTWSSVFEPLLFQMLIRFTPNELDLSHELTNVSLWLLRKNTALEEWCTPNVVTFLSKSTIQPLYTVTQRITLTQLVLSLRGNVRMQIGVSLNQEQLQLRLF